MTKKSINLVKVRIDKGHNLQRKEEKRVQTGEQRKTREQKDEEWGETRREERRQIAREPQMGR